jgi:hypothetical protein
LQAEFDAVELVGVPGVREAEVMVSDTTSTTIEKNRKLFKRLQIERKGSSEQRGVSEAVADIGAAANDEREAAAASSAGEDAEEDQEEAASCGAFVGITAEV